MALAAASYDSQEKLELLAKLRAAQAQAASGVKPCQLRDVMRGLRKRLGSATPATSKAGRPKR